MVMTKVSQFRWAIKPHASDTVFNILQPAIRFTKEECLDLPDMTYTNRHVELTRQQKKYYDMLRKRMTMTEGDDEVTAMNAAIIMNKLLQISAGAVYTDEGDTLEFDIKHRYKVLKEVVDESSQTVQILIPFGCFRLRLLSALYTCVLCRTLTCHLRRCILLLQIFAVTYS